MQHSLSPSDERLENPHVAESVKSGHASAHSGCVETSARERGHPQQDCRTETVGPGRVEVRGVQYRTML
jgi:hypothetical protein